MANYDYKAAYENLINAIRFDAEYYSDLNDARAKECDCLLAYARSSFYNRLNENGRVSIHLIDSCTERCVYDLDCNPDDVPARVWSEILDTVNGTVSRVSSQSDHIHEVRMNGAFGVPIWYVHAAGERYYWVNDDDMVVSGPEIWEAWYRDTAFALC